MPDGLTVNEIIKAIDPDNDGKATLDERQLSSVTDNKLGIGSRIGAAVMGENIGRRVTGQEAQEAVQAFGDFSKQSFNGDLDATFQFLKEAADANPEIGNVDFAEAVNSGRAAEFVGQTNSPVSVEEQPIPSAETTVTALPSSTLDGLKETFRANESINESGFAEGIVVSQNMPNMIEQFGDAAPMPSLESEMESIRLEQTNAILESVGIDANTVLSDGKIEDLSLIHI